MPVIRPWTARGMSPVLLTRNPYRRSHEPRKRFVFFTRSFLDGVACRRYGVAIEPMDPTSCCCSWSEGMHPGDGRHLQLQQGQHLAEGRHVDHALVDAHVGPRLRHLDVLEEDDVLARCDAEIDRPHRAEVVFELLDLQLVALGQVVQVAVR